ncbi:MAG: Rpn family recombination-promoting nuclease/putative transposase [Muribaculaceae bacterium]|nr:Rpn family recombination-promoting nuclease/putative transposase [Muribaculaceae bacterium]
MGKFINPFTDEGFKRIFGQEIHKDLLISFLNELIHGDNPIVDIVFRDKEIFPQFFDGRRIIYDIYCTTENGEHVIVEMQNAAQPFFKDRSIFYAASAIAQQGERGKDWNFDVKRVYGIFFLNFYMDGLKDWSLCSEVSLHFKGTTEQFSDKLHLYYITLPKMEKSESECETDFERWIYILKHMETLERMPFKAQNMIFGRLEEVCNLNSLSRQERLNYDESLKVYRDGVAVIEYAEQRGMEKGREETLATNIRTMRNAGLDASTIARYLALTPDEVEKYF